MSLRSLHRKSTWVKTYKTIRFRKERGRRPIADPTLWRWSGEKEDRCRTRHQARPWTADAASQRIVAVAGTLSL